MFPYFILSQGLHVESSLDTNHANIGDVITWSIRTENKQTKKVFFPILEDNNEKISILSHSLIMDKNKNIGIIFEIICWDTGKYVTPYYAVEVLNKNGTLDYLLEVIPNDFKISSLLPNLENPEFRPIFGPVPVSNPFPIKLIIICILLILTFYLILLTWNTRVKNKFQKAKYQFLETPKDRALKRFQNLNDKKNVKDFYSEISNISKEYFETRYYLLVLEMTTQEIEINRSLFPFDDSTFSKWVELLRQADLIMYANITVNEKAMEMDKIKLNEIIN